MKQKLLNYTPSIAITLIFIIWTILVKTTDVSYINGVGYLGFYSMNSKVNNFVVEFNRSDIFDKLTDVGLYLSFLVVLTFGALGIYQWVKRKSLKKVDPILFVLLATYLIAVAYYLIFEIAKINYSPLSTPEELKASYPSSHILFFLVFIGSGLIVLFNYINVSKIVRIVSYGLFGVLSAIYSVGRLFSLNHYFSDVIGAILLACSVLAIFIALKKDFVKVKEENK